MKIARQAATLVSKRANHTSQFGFGMMDFWSFLGTTKQSSAVTPYAEAPQAACTSKAAVIDAHNAQDLPAQADGTVTDSIAQGACPNQVNQKNFDINCQLVKTHYKSTF